MWRVFESVFIYNCFDLLLLHKQNYGKENQPFHCIKVREDPTHAKSEVFGKSCIFKILDDKMNERIG